MNDSSIFGLYNWSKDTPDRPMLTDGRITLSYSDFAKYVDLLAAGLAYRGIKKGDKIVVSLPNVVEYALLMFACLKLGILLICINMQFREQELGLLIDRLGVPKLAFLSRDYQIKIWKEKMPELEIITVCPESKALSSIQHLLMPDFTANQFSPDNEAFIIFTSGSSGAPKGVIVTPNNLYGQIQAMAARFHATSEDVMYIPGPFCQMSGMPWLFLICCVGGKAITGVRFDGKKAISLIAEHKVTILSGVTTMFYREIQAYKEMRDKPDISSLRTGALGGAPVSRSYMEYFDRVAGCKLVNAYGMTECPGILMGDCDDPAEVRYSKTGRALSNVSICLLSDDCDPVPVGEPGEICCKSTGVTKGYYNDPEQTLTMLDSEGRLHTGDIGVQDPDGYITLIGRKKEMIIRGGYNVFPAEIESAFYSHPQVSLAVAVPYNDSEFGQKIALFIQLNEQVNEDDLYIHVKKRLAKYKLPDDLIVLENIPLMASGKINKTQLLNILYDKIR